MCLLKIENDRFSVQAVQAGLLMGAGDLCAQKFFTKQETVDIDYIRTLKFFSIGFLLVVRMCSEKLNTFLIEHSYPFRALVFAFGMVSWTKPSKLNHL